MIFSTLPNAVTGQTALQRLSSTGGVRLLSDSPPAFQQKLALLRTARTDDRTDDRRDNRTDDRTDDFQQKLALLRTGVTRTDGRRDSRTVNRRDNRTGDRTDDFQQKLALLRTGVTHTDGTDVRTDDRTIGGSRDAGQAGKLRAGLLRGKLRGEKHTTAGSSGPTSVMTDLWWGTTSPSPAPTP